MCCTKSQLFKRHKRTRPFFERVLYHSFVNMSSKSSPRVLYSVNVISLFSLPLFTAVRFQRLTHLGVHRPLSQYSLPSYCESCKHRAQLSRQHSTVKSLHQPQTPSLSLRNESVHRMRANVRTRLFCQALHRLVLYQLSSERFIARLSAVLYRLTMCNICIIE